MLVSLFLVNTRAAYYFVLALVSPREIPETSKDPADFLPAEPPPPEPASVPGARRGARRGRRGGGGAGHVEQGCRGRCAFDERERRWVWLPDGGVASA